jgi:cell wall assembly regulator SMI1
MNETRLVNDLGLKRLSGAREAGPELVQELEESFGVLPKDYKDFLIKFSASRFSQDVVFTLIQKSPWSKEGVQSLDDFYGFSEKGWHDLHEVNNQLKGDIPDDTVAIANDAGSNLILLSLNQDTFGHVLFFDRDSAKTYLIARSFTEFLDSFRKNG